MAEVDSRNLSGVDSPRQIVFEAAKDFGRLFYITDLSETTFEDVTIVPHYVQRSFPYFVLLIFLEAIVRKIQGKPTIRVNDAVGSLSAGFCLEISETFTHSLNVAMYVWAYENYRLLQLDWSSTWTWVWAALLVDFFYYWFHRCSHEVHIIWAGHQTHHSSEEYNLTTALRQSVLQHQWSLFFNIPMAIFGIPPSHWVVHRQLNLLYQFWIHTETIKSLGILEYVLNTPSHHRVHHGCNRYCLDKNYAGVLIIWDRMFGTFQPEQEEVVYGLTHAINTFDPIVIQLGHLGYVLRTFKETQGIGNKLSVLFKGPGWSPGKPRLGLMEDLPDHKAPMKKFDPPMAGWVQLYLMVHLNLTTAMLHVYIGASTNLSILSHVMSTCFLVFCLVCFGTIANGDLVRGRRLEIARCLMTLVVLQGQWMSPVMTKAMSFTFFLSGYLWWTYGSGKIEKED